MSDEAPVTPTATSINGGVNGSEKQQAYTDQTADVTLVSSNGRQFKVHSYFLKANSTYFRDYLSGNNTGEPIKVDASPTVLKEVLDVMHLRAVHPSAIWKSRDAILKLCDQYKFVGVADRVVSTFHESLEKSPWDVFCVASQRNNAALAKAALKTMAAQDFEHALHHKHNKHVYPDVDKLTPALAASVTLPFLLGLLNAALFAAEHPHATDHANGEFSGNGHHHEKHDKVNWKVIADKFSPVVG